MSNYPPEGHYHERCQCPECQRFYQEKRLNPYNDAEPPHGPKVVKCDHPDFNANVAVNRLQDTGRFQADVTIHCAKCQLPFRFIGLPAGLDLDGAATSADATEGRFSVAPKGEVRAPLEGGSPQGFSVRRR